ncbi:hypothetical protein H6F77_19600 [Microcoleus sp. FACHB-831]|uniref:hypothetical protein n=1 Tax=Microcoleus sp. FACHB-831 TaxID=2692827 RepID=UPI001681F125|nr:hypothetical protein [Microcoleus sp. FACHB-831]MBD1923259.1 hypothetical protein [Microcoleus sp. FACHB-831]
MKTELNFKQARKLALLAASAFLFVTPSVGATELISDRGRIETSVTNTRNIPLLLAQNTCPPNAGGGRLVNYFETASFHVYICRTSKGLFYTGISKSNGTGTRPLKARTEEGTGYVVKTGDITYIVNGASLSVFKGRKLLQEEEVISSR